MNTKTIYKLAGISALLAGMTFAIIQFIHPAESLEAISTNRWEVAHILNVIFPVLALLGITGIYAKQIKESGKLGFLGYMLLFGAFSLMLCFGFYEAFIAPLLAVAAPSFAMDVMSILDNKPGPGLVGEVYQLNGALYLLGGLTFAIATIRAKVYPLYAGSILGMGVLVTLSAAAFPIMARPSAVVFSIGLGLLGLTLIRLVSRKALIPSLQQVVR
jgi:hypothetical protein